MRVLTTIFWLGVTAAAMPTYALTAQQSVLKEVTRVGDNGQVEIVYEDASLVVPGETIIYRLDYTNDQNAAVSDMVLTMPVPPEVTYKDGSANIDGANVLYSTDKAETFTSRESLMTKTKTGDIMPAAAADITHIRWIFTTPIDAREAGHLSFTAVLK